MGSYLPRFYGVRPRPFKSFLGSKLPIMSFYRTFQVCSSGTPVQGFLFFLFPSLFWNRHVLLVVEYSFVRTHVFLFFFFLFFFERTRLFRAHPVDWTDPLRLRWSNLGNGVAVPATVAFSSRHRLFLEPNILCVPACVCHSTFSIDEEPMGQIISLKLVCGPRS